MRWDSENAAGLAGLTHAAERGDDWSVEKLLSRPLLSSDAEQHFAVFLTLSRDRPNESISMGMAGGVLLPRPISRETIRKEGRRLGYDGDALDDFVEIITLIDDFHVETAVRKAAADAKAAADRRKSPPR